MPDLAISTTGSVWATLVALARQARPVARQSVALAGRNLLRMRRSPAVIVGTFVVPTVLMMGFFVVLRRLMDRHGVDYEQFLPPAITVQAMFFVAMGSALWIADDVSNGMLARLRTTPTSLLAPLLGRLLADLVRAAAATGTVVSVGLAIGFRFRTGPWGVVGYFVLALALAGALAALFGLLASRSRNPETAADSLQIPYLPLMMLSTAFVPAAAFPDWLSDVVRYQPVSVMVDALRVLSGGGRTTDYVLAAAAWLVASYLVVFVHTVRTPGSTGR